EDRIGHKGDRLYSWMEFEEAFAILARERVCARISPDIGSVATIFSELDIVAMGCFAVLEHKDELVLRAIERSHAGVRLSPDTEILEFAIGCSARGEHFAHVAPVHAQIVQRS